MGNRQHLRVLVAVGCLEGCQVVLLSHDCHALALELLHLVDWFQRLLKRHGTRVQVWTMQQELVWSLCAAPGVGCGDPQRLGYSVRSLHCGQIGPCADLVRCSLTNLRRAQAADGSDSLLVLGSQLSRCDGGDRNLVQAFLHHPGLGRQTFVESAEARRISRRDRHIHLASLQMGLPLQVHHRNRPSVGPVPLKSPEDARFRRQKTLWFRPAGTVQTGESDRVATPGRKEFRHKASRSPRRTRRNHGREPA